MAYLRNFGRLRLFHCMLDAVTTNFSSKSVVIYSFILKLTILVDNLSFHIFSFSFLVLIFGLILIVLDRLRIASIRKVKKFILCRNIKFCSIHLGAMFRILRCSTQIFRIREFLPTFLSLAKFHNSSLY